MLAWLTPIRAAGQEAREAPPVPGDLLVRDGDTSLIPLTPDDVPFDGRGVMVWALAPVGDILKDGSPLNRILLARLNPSSLSAATSARAVDDIVAYSAICTSGRPIPRLLLNAVPGLRSSMK